MTWIAMKSLLRTRTLASRAELGPEFIILPFAGQRITATSYGNRRPPTRPRRARARFKNLFMVTRG